MNENDVFTRYEDRWVTAGSCSLYGYVKILRDPYWLPKTLEDAQVLLTPEEYADMRPFVTDE